MNPIEDVELTPAEREQIGQVLGRVIGWIVRDLGLPWWGAVTLLVVLCVAVFAAVVFWPEVRRRLVRRARRMQAASRRKVAAFNLAPTGGPDAPVLCGHCGKPCIGGGFADGKQLCHTGTLPPYDDPQDCYRLVTVYRHSADGSCCAPWRHWTSERR